MATYGIDLGTTYSCISYVDKTGRPVVLKSANGEDTTPSVVYFESPDNVVVGRQAKDSAVEPRAPRAEAGPAHAAAQRSSN